VTTPCGVTGCLLGPVDVWCPAHADTGTVIVHLEDPDVLAAARDAEHMPCVPAPVTLPLLERLERLVHATLRGGPA
jgi:hypothetical protein